MSFIKNAIVEASRSTACKVTQLSEKEASFIRKSVEELYAASKVLLPLWERLRDEKSKYDPDGWKKIIKFPYKDKVTIFFDRDNETTMFSVASHHDVVQILSECPGFVFYLTNENCSFLVCHNDHDYLIGAGLAKEWISDGYLIE